MRPAAVAGALALCGAAVAGVYKWVDDKGRVHYGDAPPRGASAVQGETRVDAEAVDLRWYAVTGTDSRAMWQSIAQNGPRGQDGKVFAGRTDWDLGYRYQTRMLDGQCRVTGVTARVEVVMHLPRWQDESRAPAELRDRWRRYVVALREHENGHRDHGLAATAEVQARLASLPPRPSCAGYDDRVRALANEIVASYVERDREYDRRTAHGLEQGARFP